MDELLKAVDDYLNYRTEYKLLALAEARNKFRNKIKQGMFGPPTMSQLHSALMAAGFSNLGCEQGLAIYRSGGGDRIVLE